MKNVYVLLDNDMEDGVITADIYSTYEKAEKDAKETIQELKDQYDEIEEYDHGWLFIDDDSTVRTLEIQANIIK